MMFWCNKYKEQIERLKLLLTIAENDIRNLSKKLEQKKKSRAGRPKQKTHKVNSCIALVGVGDGRRICDKERAEIFDNFVKGMDITDLGKLYTRSHSGLYRDLKIEGEKRYGKQMGSLSRKKFMALKEKESIR